MPLHAIVVGASSGIGLSSARALRTKGYLVSALSRRAAPEGAADVSIPCDVEDANAIARALDEAVRAHGVPTVVIYASGAPVMGDTLHVPPTDARRAFEVNLWGFDGVARHILPTMMAAKGGTLVYVSSIVAVRSIPFEAYYAASKAAAARYAGCLDQEVRARGVRVKSLHVGFVDTGFMERGGWHGMDAQRHNGSGVTADDVANALLRLVDADRSEEIFGWREKIIALSDRISPAIYDRVLRLRAQKGGREP